MIQDKLFPNYFLTPRLQFESFYYFSFEEIFQGAIWFD